MAQAGREGDGLSLAVCSRIRAGARVRRTISLRPFSFQEASLMGTLGRLALSLGAAALFAGCGGSRPPIGAPSLIPQAPALAVHTK